VPSRIFSFFKKDTPEATAPGAADFGAVAASADAAIAFGNSTRAIELYTAFLELVPEHAQAHYKRANVLNGLGRSEEALCDYDRAVALDPQFSNAYCNRGSVLVRMSRWHDALESFDRAIALNPNDHLAYSNRAAPLRALSRVDEALADYDRALALRRDHVDAQVNRGNLLQEMQRYEEALASYDAALETNSANPELHFNRGTVLQKLQRHKAAVDSFDRSLALRPTIAEAFRCRGFSLLQLGRTEDAIASYEQVMALEPDYPYIIGMRRHAQMQIFDWAGFETDMATIQRDLTAGRKVCLPFPLLALVDSPHLHRLAADIYVQDQCPPSDALAPIAPRARRDRIRIGYVSGDFRDHPVSHLTAGLFESHDRSKFEILAFAYGGEAQDPIRERLERAFDRFIDVSDKSDIETASLARELGVDIAVDLTGFTGANRTQIFALRAAPIQISYLGYLGTMGAPYMDYLLAELNLVPDDERQHYAERIIHLPSYQVNDSLRRTADDRTFSREELGLPPRGFVFSCFNANYKITPATFAVWMRILKRVDGSLLFLYAASTAAQRNLLAESARHGIEAERIVFGPRLGFRDYMARYRAMDLFLDTLPYNAGTTASDALWAGLPVLTCMGRGFAGRVAASLLLALDLPELITATAVEYEELAVRLATNPQELARINEALAMGRAGAPLFDTAGFTRNLERAYVQVHERYLSNLPPADIAVRP
jgi:predicted O-linked N-acetylglucosamine transferase (SPINDLY family)